ncbi:coatomer subunit delta Ecym_6007 [Eremothecium cymbalariae DBVPG|uniref:Coatomer subunit delta n=1 Tax=Eremothecium cymbalariae (strain CBS 270.75 / DBVPG 7215 / KCTC 17166 / NRRL Y-17582) TaxID=931890 RepID=G8JUT6_ERECY|nr:hypothetical protein Ecym_6007 [Eremothecium cymbalariae DBVPG\
MVVLAVSITTKSGKPLLSRQFRDITKDRVMELLSNFQNLVASSSREHTFVEEEHVRYIYIPFDDYYIILITNRQSNIIQDMDTLNLFSQTVNSNLKGFSEEDMLNSAFDILGSFDEIISLGYKESLSLSQINTFLSMESHEEKIQEIIERNKEFEAAEERKRRELEISKKEFARRQGKLPPSWNDNMKFQGSNMSNAYNSYYSNASPAAQQSFKHLQQQQHTIEDGSFPTSPAASAINTPRGSGMKLTGKRGINVPDLSAKTSASPSKPAVSMLQSDEVKKINNGILVSVKETISAEISRDGSVTTSELKGVLELRINDPDLARARILLDPKVEVKDRSFQFKTHPNVDKNLFMSSKIIGLKDPQKAFPSNDQSLGVLRWRKVGSSDDNSLIPLNVSTWVSPSSDGTFDITLEYDINEEYNQQLKDLRFVVPIYTTNATIKEDANEVNGSIESIDEEHGVIIRVDPIAPGESGVVGFTIKALDEDALFPMSVVFSNPDEESIFSQVAVAQVQSSTEEGKQLPFDVTSTLRTDEYVIV